MKCNYCENELEDISFSNAAVWLSHKEPATLWACTSQDCKNCGVVLAIPWTNKDEEECPDHEDGHHFISCDDLSATCSCGKSENE